MNMRRKMIIAAPTAIMAALCLISCTGKGMAGGAGPSGPRSSAGLSEAKAVRVQAAEVRTLRPYVDQSGDVEASIEVTVYPDIGGKVADLSVALGDSVKKGQTIASVDPSKPGASYSISPVTSPISGTVTSVPVDPGATVTSSTAIAKVGVIDELKIVVNLPERDSAKVRAGMSASISLAALPAVSLKAEVARVSPVLDPTSRTRELTLRFLSKDERLAAGMYASARIFIAPLPDRVVIPEESVIAQDGEAYVFIVVSADGATVAKKAPVKTGIAVDGELEVLSGLKAGDQVVVEGQDSLGEGKKVEPRGDK
jgi:membrane fusion protein, multidrug efflux system